MMNSSRVIKYLAIYQKAGQNYTVFFPAFNVSGEGYSSYEDTKRFAKDLLAEIIMDYERKNIALPTFDVQNDNGECKDEELVSLDYEIFKDLCYVNENVIIKKEIVTNIDNYKNDKTIQINENDNYETKSEQLKLNDTLKKSGLRKLVIGVTIILMIGTSLFGIVRMIGEQMAEQEIIDTINESRKYISKKKFEKGYSTLKSLTGNEKYPEYQVEIDSLYYYAYLKNERSKTKPIAISYQYSNSKLISFESSDEFYSDAEKMKKLIKAEYDIEQERIAEKEEKERAEREKREKVAALKKEKEDAKSRREYLEKLAELIPFSGLDEEYIDCTACGAHDTETFGQELYDIENHDYQPHNIYEWHVDGNLVLTVYCADGEVEHDDKLVFEDGSISDYWTDDGRPLFNSKSKTKKYYAPDSEYNYDLEKYRTGKEYADAKYLKHIKEISKNSYGTLSDKDIENIAWVKAYDEWLDLISAEEKEPDNSRN